MFSDDARLSRRNRLWGLGRVNFLYERCDDIPGDMPLVIDEAPDGNVTVFLRSDIITEAACRLLTRSTNDLVCGRVLTQRQHVHS